MAAADISLPENPDAAITLLPAGQFLYGDDCPLSCFFQSVLFHYDIRQNEVEILEEEEIYAMKQVRLANPDGDQEQRDAFEDAVCKRIARPI